MHITGRVGARDERKWRASQRERPSQLIIICLRGRAAQLQREGGEEAAAARGGRMFTQSSRSTLGWGNDLTIENHKSRRMVGGCQYLAPRPTTMSLFVQTYWGAPPHPDREVEGWEMRSIRQLTVETAAFEYYRGLDSPPGGATPTRVYAWHNNSRVHYHPTSHTSQIVLQGGSAWRGLGSSIHLRSTEDRRIAWCVVNCICSAKQGQPAIRILADGRVQIVTNKEVDRSIGSIGEGQVFAYT